MVGSRPARAQEYGRLFLAKGFDTASFEGWEIFP